MAPLWLVVLCGALVAANDDQTPAQSDLHRELGDLLEVLTALRGELKGEDWRRALQDGLGAARRELRELAAAVDVPSRLRDERNAEAGMARLRDDLGQLGRQLASLRAEQQRQAAAAAQRDLDLSECRSRLADLFADRQRVATQIEDIRDEVRQNSYLLTMPHPTDPPAPPVKQKRSPRHPEEAHLRHTGHHFKKEMDHLRRRMDNVEKRQEQLQTELLLLKKQERGLEDQVEEKLPLPETNTSAIAKLHASTVQLFEALESLEGKVDREVGELQREVSKVESGAARANAALQEVKEARSEQDEQLKAHGRSIAALQHRAANTTLWLARLETETALRHTGDLLREPRGTVNRLAEEVREIHQEALRMNHDLTLLVEQFPKDCSARDSRSSGAMLVHLPGMTQQVYCDEEWTVIHRRVDDTEEFDRDWAAYKAGFGDRARNFWAGNDFLHLLTQSANYTLRVDMWDTSGVYRYAQYASVQVNGEEDNYRLQLDGFHGNASDALAYHNQMNFSTTDRDRDQSASSNCAQYYASGWWYNQCQYVNLNGHFARGITWFDREAHEWLQLGKAEMRLRPR